MLGHASVIADGRDAIDHPVEIIVVEHNHPVTAVVGARDQFTETTGVGPPRKQFRQILYIGTINR